MSVEPEERPAGVPGGGAEEAEQVDQFLEKEHEKFQKVEPPPVGFLIWVVLHH